MFVDMTRGRPITCSKCGSTNAIKPVNNRSVEIQCGDCGHTKLTREAERRKLEREHPELRQGWVGGRSGADENPTF